MQLPQAPGAPIGLANAAAALRPLPVLVLGDLILDEYVHGWARRISPEAPVPVLTVERRETRCGGAANVALNLARLGARVRCGGAVGADPEGRQLLALLSEAGVDAEGILVDPGRVTPLKTRMIAHTQQLLRVDRERAAPLEAGVEAALARWLAAVGGDVSLGVLSDYAKGTLSGSLVRAAREALTARGVPVIAGIKDQDPARFRSLTGAMLNRAELERIVGPGDPRLSGEALRRELALQFLVVTLSEEGMCVLHEGGALTRPAQAREVFDVTGAGDTALATFALARGSGLSLERAADLANLAAGLSVSRQGAVAVSPRELAEGSGARARAPGAVPREQVERALAVERAHGRTVVFTNGCFDLLHAGHLALLRFARDQGDLLVVGLNTDRSVRALKGEGRPVVPERQRAALLAALDCVDHVVLFDEDTPLDLIDALRPDVLVKGADYQGRRLVGEEIVLQRGGRVALAPLVPGLSTTALLGRAAAR